MYEKIGLNVDWNVARRAPRFYKVGSVTRRRRRGRVHTT